jgi:hypothetical protein
VDHCGVNVDVCFSLCARHTVEPTLAFLTHASFVNMIVLVFLFHDLSLSVVTCQFQNVGIVLMVVAVIMLMLFMAMTVMV